MSDKFKEFVTGHRQEFDTGEPGKDLLDKIDAQLELKEPSRISSKWLSRFGYLGFSISVLLVALYFSTRTVFNSSAGGEPIDHKEMAMKQPVPEIRENKKGIAAQENKTFAGNPNTRPEHKAEIHASMATASLPERKSSKQDRQAMKEGSGVNTSPAEAPVTSQDDQGTEPMPAEGDEPKGDPMDERKTSDPATKRKKANVPVPEAPDKLNTYTGALYEGSSLCTVLRAYKFSGKIGMDAGARRKDGGQKYNKSVLKMISCSSLDSMPNVKAIWLKGKTDKRVTIPVKKGFKNMVLVKKDGRQLYPEAISHYYRGRFVITEYKGRYMNMVFTDKVDLILFFKDAEAGDRVIIDGTIEVILKNQQ